MHSPIYLDFVRDRRHRKLLGATLLVLAVAGCAALVAWLATLNAALQSVEQRSAAYTRRAMPAAVATATLDAEEAKKLTAGLRQLTTPWEDLLGAVETAASGDIAVLSLQQEAAQASFKLTAEARDADAMFDYVRRLGAARRIQSATIDNHKIEHQQPGRPVRFTLSARYTVQQP